MPKPRSAFTITMYEFEATIPTLWGHVKGKANVTFPYLCYSPSVFTDFVKKHPEYIAKDNALGFMSSDKGETYNLCHCQSFLPLPIPILEHAPPQPVWSNFEIADLDFWRSEAYTKFFDYLEAQGGFYYEVRRNILSPPTLFPHTYFSVGAMHRSIPSRPHCFCLKTKSTSSTISATNTHRITTVLWI